MFVLVTDFGLEGPYTGQMKAVLQAAAPQRPVIDLFADAPAFDPRLTAYLLPSYASRFPPESIFVVVVDPGVGGARRAIAVRADRHWYVGPDNGIFELILRRAGESQAWQIPLPENEVSASFHGRDIFAPAAARIALDGGLADANIVSPTRFEDWPDDLPAVVYVDRYGNLVTGLRAGTLSVDHRLTCAAERICHARVFSEVEEGELFWYENANGLVEIAANRVSAAKVLGAGVGTEVSVVGGQ